MTPRQTDLRNPAPLTISAVAAAAGVSKTTVSHVLSGKRPVSAETRLRVEKVMRRLGFRPNYFASALNSNHSGAVAVIVQDLTNPFYPALARGLQESVAAADEVLTLFDAGAGADMTHAFVEEIVRRRIDGVVVAAADAAADLELLANAGVAVVTVGSALSGSAVDWASADDRRIGYDATTYLLDKGHTRIAAVTGPAGAEPGRGRLAGYRQALAEHGVAADDAWCVASDWTREGGAAATRALLDLDRPPTAIFCANDLMAIGALDLAHDRGLESPRDLAVVGVDDIEAAGLVRPGLTTVRVPAQEIGRAAGDLLLHRIAEPGTGARRHVLVQHTLVPRQSA